MDQFLRDAAAAQRLRANPLGSQLDSFAAWLSQLGTRGRRSGNRCGPWPRSGGGSRRGRRSGPEST